MKKESFVKPEWIDSYCVEREVLSDCVKKWTYDYQNEHGYMYICHPYPGVHLWANDVFLSVLPTERLKEYHFIKLNYCSLGRAEVQLWDDRYVYLEKGNISIDSNAPKKNFLYPGGRYAGLELVLDMEVLRERPVQALLDCGIDPEALLERLSRMQGSYIAAASGEWRELAEHVAEKLKRAEGRIEDFRFDTIRLLYLLEKGGTAPIEKKFYLTRGQRMIVAAVEEKISMDLKQHHSVEALAAEHGISPSSLKKYFEQVYGITISGYLRRKRMEYACRLLTETKSSIADIAAEAGYSNQGKFGSAFKKYTNKTPLEYRRLQNTQEKKKDLRERML